MMLMMRRMKRRRVGVADGESKLHSLPHKHRVHLFTRLLVSAAARIYPFAYAASQTLLAVPRRLIAWSFVCRGTHAH